MATLDSRSAPPSRIENAVERELARRRRLLRLYLLLLLIPLGLAVWFLLTGRSDHELVRQTVEERVAPVEQRYQQIAPKLDQVETLDRSLPVVEKAAQQLQAQEKQVETLRQEVRAIQPAVEEIRATQASLSRSSDSGEVKELATRLAAVEKDLAGYQQLSTRLAVMEKEQRQVVVDLKEVSARVDKQTNTPGVSPQDIQKLNDRLRLLEQGTGELRKDFTKLRVGIKERPPG